MRLKTCDHCECVINNENKDVFNRGSRTFWLTKRLGIFKGSHKALFTLAATASHLGKVTLCKKCVLEAIIDQENKSKSEEKSELIICDHCKKEAEPSEYSGTRRFIARITQTDYTTLIDIDCYVDGADTCNHCMFECLKKGIEDI